MIQYPSLDVIVLAAFLISNAPAFDYYRFHSPFILIEINLILFHSRTYVFLLPHRPVSLTDCMLTPETVPADSPKELYELYFCFCCVWAFGASMFQDQVSGQAGAGRVANQFHCTFPAPIRWLAACWLSDFWEN